MIVALQTADATTRLWLVDPAQPLPAAPTLVWESGRGLADGLLQQLTQTLAGAKLALTDVTGLVIFSGPGSFTSLRIGHSVVNALADSLAVPVIGAMGDNWLQQGIKQLAATPLGRPALPHYGASANITKPKH